MAVLEICTFPNPVLKQKSRPIQKIDPKILQLVQDMAETMYSAPGVGLAAPQVGHSLRLAVIDVTPADGPKKLLVLINPEIVESWDEWEYDEGCLSVPGVSAEIVRPEGVRVRFLDDEGRLQEEEFHRLWSRVLQHEIDHLDGRLFVDYLSPMRRALLLKKLKELAKESKTRLAL